ncbi:MAG: hypothetical protein PHH36_01065 [Sideroxydans sp.]|nr:hypothetical protein [Sideroxydans sp.]
MDGLHTPPHYPANWQVRFLCDCKKQGKPIKIHEGFAHDISSKTMHIRSDHQICSGKEVAIMLKIPPLQQGEEQSLVKLVGRSVVTVAHAGDFLTEIRFTSFEGDGYAKLSGHLARHFGNQFYPGQSNAA